MTRDQISALISNNLEDAGLNFFTSTDINSSIQDAYDDITAFCMQIEKTATFSIAANRVYYNLRTLVPDGMVVTRVYNQTTKQWLLPSSSRILDQIRWDWELWTGEPKMWFPHSYDYLCIAPHKTVSSGTLLIYYRAMADTLAGTSAPQMQLDAFKLLEKYATFDLLTQAREWAKAIFWYGEYISGLQEYKISCRSNAVSDFITGLRG